ncbi:hypothetical protein BGP75_24050 [Motiliproteus sp. MSK22-1]|nr:hypothetical protein BGP75_24050 [Motiliproteus sp. MSK22-1]
MFGGFFMAVPGMGMMMMMQMMQQMQSQNQMQQHQNQNQGNENTNNRQDREIDQLNDRLDRLQNQNGGGRPMGYDCGNSGGGFAHGAGAGGHGGQQTVHHIMHF